MSISTTGLTSVATPLTQQSASFAVGNSMDKATNQIMQSAMESSNKQTGVVNGNIYAVDNIGVDGVNTIQNAGGSGTGTPVTISDSSIQDSLCTLFGLDKGTFQTTPAPQFTITNLPSTGGVGGPNSVVSVEIKFVDKSGKASAIGCELDNNGGLTAFAPENQSGGGDAASLTAISPQTMQKVDSSSLLASWGINASDMSPGDLFLLQQKISTLKDLISTVETTGKTSGDVMREVTQKFSQG